MEHKYIIDPKEVAPKEEQRVRNWAATIMTKNEYKLNDEKFKHLEIVTSGIVEPEDIDMRLIYPFPDLNWIIYRNKQYWSIMLRSKEKMLCVITYAQI